MAEHPDPDAASSACFGEIGVQIVEENLAHSRRMPALTAGLRSDSRFVQNCRDIAVAPSFHTAFPHQTDNILLSRIFNESIPNAFEPERRTPVHPTVQFLVMQGGARPFRNQITL